MIMQLFYFHVNSPRSKSWPILFFCNAKDCQMVKSFLSSIKTVALVQSDFEFKKGSHFYCCQNWSNQFWKIQKNARIKILRFIDFFHLVFSSQNSPKHLLYIFLNGKGYCLQWGN